MRILTASAILSVAACAPPQADSFHDVPELTPQDTLSCEETTLDFFDVNSDRIHPSKVRYGASTEDGTLDPTGRSPVYITIGDGGNRENLYDVWEASSIR